MSKKNKSKFNSYNNLSFQRKKRIWMIRGSIVGKILFFTLLYLFFFTPHLKFIKTYLWENLYEFAGEMGFTLETVVIKGNHNIDSKDVVSSLNADVGTPLFAISLQNIYEKLKENGWVKDVTVHRKLPKTIQVNITERIPIAVWQHQKKLFLIDHEGNVINSEKVENFGSLLHVVGVDANLHAHSLIEDLSQNPIMAANVVYAVRYGERRWNLILKQNITVKMPESGFEKAYNYLCKLNDQGKLFDQNYKLFDLRDHAKYYMEKM